jgi:hypothetical protein
MTKRMIPAIIDNCVHCPYFSSYNICDDLQGISCAKYDLDEITSLQDDEEISIKTKIWIDDLCELEEYTMKE